MNDDKLSQDQAPELQDKDEYIREIDLGEANNVSGGARKTPTSVVKAPPIPR